MSINTIVGMTPELSEGTDLYLETRPLADNYGVKLAKNDPVKIVSGKIQRWTAGDTVAMAGTFQGVSFTKTDGTFVRQKYWDANTRTLNAEDAEAEIMPVKSAIYTILCNTEANSADRATEAKVKQYADIEIGDGDSVQGSIVTLDASTLSTTKAQLQLEGLVDEPGNEWGDGAKVRVRVNEHINK